MLLMHKIVPLHLLTLQILLVPITRFIITRYFMITPII